INSSLVKSAVSRDWGYNLNSGGKSVIISADIVSSIDSPPPQPPKVLPMSADGKSPSQTSKGDIIFTGGSAEEAEDFIFAIKKRAYSKGKHKDNVWIADFVSVCFAKKALRWYERLDEEIQDDWKLLKRAILDEYEVASLPSSTLPTSASALQRYLYSY
ncbi:hypothetical protein FRC01_005835, partial [Tulasnella sp. 417]